MAIGIGSIDSPFVNRGTAPMVEVQPAIPANSVYKVNPGLAPGGVKIVPDAEPLRELREQVVYGATTGYQWKFKAGVVSDMYWLQTSVPLAYGDIDIVTPWGETYDATVLMRNLEAAGDKQLFGLLSPGYYTFKAKKDKTWRFCIRHMDSDV